MDKGEEYTGVQFNNWNLIYYHPKVKRLNFGNSNFNGNTLSKLQFLEHLNISRVYLGSWSHIRFGPNIKQLYLYRTDFCGNLRYLKKLEELDLEYVK
eukprot:UN02807